MTMTQQRRVGITAVLALALATVVVARSTTFTGTVEQVDKARIEVAVKDAHGTPGKPVWFAVTGTTKVTRGGVVVPFADAKIKVGETATIVVHAGDEAGVEWTCAMHPEIAEPTAGKCAKCGMNLRERARPAKAAEIALGK